MPLRYKPDQPIYIRNIHLEGLHIHLPPKSHFLHTAPAPIREDNASQPGVGGLPVRFQLGNVDCKDAVLVLETSKPGKLPLEIDIARRKLSGISPNSAMHYEAELTNPRPVGTIHTKGVFGPWQVTDPGESPIAGDHRFDDANLGDFKGIAGTLSSNGNYVGTLRDLNVDGQTDTPDFSLTHFGNTMDLKTQFHAIVDGTNGDSRSIQCNAVGLFAHHCTRASRPGVCTGRSRFAPFHRPRHRSLNQNRQRAHRGLSPSCKPRGHAADHKPGPPVFLRIPPARSPFTNAWQRTAICPRPCGVFQHKGAGIRIEELSLRGQGCSHTTQNPRVTPVSSPTCRAISRSDTASSPSPIWSTLSRAPQIAFEGYTANSRRRPACIHRSCKYVRPPFQRDGRRMERPSA